MPAHAADDRAVRLLLACVRPPGAAAGGAFDGDGGAWDRCWHLASAHKVAGVAARGVLAAGDRVPHQVRTHAAELAARVTVRGLALARVLERALDALDAAGVRALAFRGCVLGVDAFGGLGVRQHVDLDLLVARRELRAAADALGAAGMPLDDRSARLIRSRLAWVEHHLACGVEDARTTVELHAELLPWFFALDLDTDALFARGRHVTVGRRVCLALSPEDQFLELAAHGAKHGWSTFRIASDAAAAAHPALDWDRVLASASAAGARRLVLGACALAEHWMAWTPPADVHAAIGRDPFARALPALAGRSWFGTAPAPPLQRVWLDTACRERWRDRVRYCARAAAEPVLMGLAQVGRPV